VRIFGRLCRFVEGDNLGTFFLPLEDQYCRINKHNIKKLGKNIGEVQGDCMPSLTLKGNQRILMRFPCRNSNSSGIQATQDQVHSSHTSLGVSSNLNSKR